MQLNYFNTFNARDVLTSYTYSIFNALQAVQEYIIPMLSGAKWRMAKILCGLYIESKQVNLIYKAHNVSEKLTESEALR